MKIGFIGPEFDLLELINHVFYGPELQMNTKRYL